MALCPYCQGSAARLYVLSSVSSLDFFQCQACSKISERPKGDAGHPSRIPSGRLLTPPPAAERAGLRVAARGPVS